MIRLAARLAVSGGRESIVRLVLTAIGVAIGTTLLLVAGAVDPAIRAQQKHTAWQYTLSDPASRQGTNDPLLWARNEDVVAGRQLFVLRVASTGPTAPVPLGLDHVPADGEVYVSPALAELLDELPADRLADRFPSAPSGTIGDDYLAGPDDLVAVVGMSTTDIQRLDPVEVHHVRTRPEPYQFTDFLRLVLGIAAIGLLVPVVVFVSTSTRIGAARREQRFAAMRLAGATPRQVHVVAAVEAGAAAAVGVVLGAVGYAVLRPYAAHVEINGHPSFLRDVRVPPVLFALILVGIPAIAVLASMVSLRRLQVSPLGVARRAVRTRPTVRRVAPLVVGTTAFVVSVAVATNSNGGGIGILIPVMASFALMIYGIVAAGPWLTVLIARAIGHAGQRASVLLAGRRLEDDPARGFRTVSGLVIAVFVASMFSGTTPAVLAEAPEGNSALVAESTLVARLPSGTSGSDGVALVDAAVASGGIDGIVLHVDPDPDRPLTNPAVGRSHTMIVACADLAVVDVIEPCPEGGTAWVDTGLDRLEVEPAPYTTEEAAAMPAEVVVVDTDGTTATTDRVRTAVEHAVPGTDAWLGAEVAREADRELVQLNRLANLALAITLTIAGCSLAVAVAAGIVERKRPFALLRLSGMQLTELQRTALLEAAAPLLLIAVASAVLGLATSAFVVAVAARIPWKLPTIGYWASLVTGLGLAVAVAAAALPLLGRVTAPSAVRFE